MNIEKINISGNEYDIKDANAQAMISDEFDSGTSYITGDYCIYENVLYKFTSNKSAGAWDSGKVTATNIDTELSSLNSSLEIRVANGKGCILYYNDFIATLWVNINLFTANNGATLPESVFSLPENVINTGNIRVTGGLLNSSWYPTGEIYYLDITPTTNGRAQFRCSSESVTNNVIACEVPIPRSYLEIN